MGIIGTTFTKGYKPAMFRNQPVHQFFGHLQAVLRNVAPSGEMEHLFARPFFDGDQGVSAEIKWMTELPGESARLTSLDPEKYREAAAVLAAQLERIRSFAEKQANAKGVEKDYSDFLRAVAMTPDQSMIFVINGKPVITHWGYYREGATDQGKAVFAGWDDFITDIRRVAPPSASAAPASVASGQNAPPEKARESSKKDEKKAAVVPVKKQSPVSPRDQDSYEWVKWLAQLLGILIILLLLQFLLNMPASQKSGGGTPSSMGSGGGGAGSGGGGMSGGSGGGGQGGNGSGGSSGGGGSGSGQPKGGFSGPGPCPTCGHAEQKAGQTLPSGQNSGQPGGQPNGQPGGQPSGAGSELPGSGQEPSGTQPGTPGGTPAPTQGQQPLPGRGQPPAQPGSSEPSGQPGGADGSGQPGDVSRPDQTKLPKDGLEPESGPAVGPEEGQPREPVVSVQIDGAQEIVLVSQPRDPGTIWTILDESGRPFISTEVSFPADAARPMITGDSARVAFKPAPGSNRRIEVRAVNARGAVTRYHFLARGR
jgi:hypothetical protein